MRKARPLRLLTLLSVLLATILIVPRADAQVVDGISLGAGISMYHGEFDYNPNNRPIAFLASGTFHGFVAADRAVGPVVLESALQYDRLRMDGEALDKTVNMVSLDLTAGFALPVPQPFFLRLYAGVSPAVQFNTYTRISEGWQERVGYEETGTRMVVTFPVGLVIQDAVRLGVRVAASPRFDGHAGGTNPIDVVSFVSLSYRFDLLR
jgi:hypothetical protein